MEFRFAEFNARRHARGAEAARLEIIEDGECVDWLWMSRCDIARNMMTFGRCPELTKADDAYVAAMAQNAAPEVPNG